MSHRSFYLEIKTRDEFRPKAILISDFGLVRATTTETVRCRHLWCEVGSGFWNERETWKSAEWIDHLGDERVSFWIARSGAIDVGFFELQKLDDEVKIEGFGLLQSWRGSGFGGGLLSAATEKAFDLGAKRIWLQTATDDHPSALPNYKKRGYRVYREEPLATPVAVFRDGADHPQ